MIKSIFLQNLRNGEFLQLITDVLTLVDKSDPTALKVQPAYDALLASKNATEQLFKISQSSPITEAIEALDARRDAAITGTTFLANGFSYSADATVQAHAKALGDHLAIFGSAIARDNYQSETATLRNIINDWTNKPNLAAALTALNLDSWKTELETANTAFNAAYIARTEEMGNASPDNLKLKRAETNAAYYQLRDKLNAHFTLNDGAEPYATVVNTVNAVIAQYNALLSGRAPVEPLPVVPAP